MKKTELYELQLLLMILTEAITIISAKSDIAFLASNITLRWVLLIDHYLTFLCLPTAPNTCFSLRLEPGKMAARSKSID